MKKIMLFFALLFAVFVSVIALCAKNAKILIDVYSFEAHAPLWLFVLSVGVAVLILLFLSEKLACAFDKQLKENLFKSGAAHNIKIKKGKVDEALILLLKTMTSTTEGDLKAARTHLKALEKIIGHGLMIDVLELKILKGEKKFDDVERLSAKLLKSKEGELVGLKNIVEASSKKKDFEKALISANKAFETRQDLYWVIENTFHLRALASDWEGALEVLDAGFKKKMVNAQRYAELKAVALYEIGLKAKKEGRDLVFLKYLTQVHHLNPSFVPAALDLAEAYDESGQTRKAEKLLKEVWRQNPTYDVAVAYLKLFKDDSSLNKVQKMETLAILNANYPSLNNFLLAELDMKAKLFDKARAEFEMFLIDNPATKKIAKLVAAYEKQVNKNKKAALSWEKRAKTCEDDCVWVCSNCGEISSKWKPFCKKCGRFNPFQWFLCVKERNK